MVVELGSTHRRLEEFDLPGVGVEASPDTQWKSPLGIDMAYRETVAGRNT
jgi:hypothetical protein